MEVIGVLLAAGRGLRFDASGRRLKLIEPLSAGPAAGQVLALAAAQALRTVLATVVAVVRADQDPNQDHLRGLLAAAGCQVLPCPPGDAGSDGMGSSIACGVGSRPHAGGWIVALADMPGIKPSTISAVRAALEHGASSAAPYFRGRRGHPVGFGAICRADLMGLRGDAGARAVLERYPPQRIDVDDPGILLDVDLVADL